MQIDIDNRTLSFVTVFVAVINTFALALATSRRKRYKGQVEWIIGNSLYALGFFLLLFQGQASRFVSIILANVGIVTSLVFMQYGIIRFTRERSDLVKSSSLVGITAAFFLYFTYVQPNTSARIFVISLIMAAISIRMAVALFRPKTMVGSGPQFFGFMVFGLYSFYFILRAIITISQPYVPELFSANLLTSIAFIVAISGNILWTIAMISIVLSRLDLERLALIDDLRKALAEVQTLEGLVPICAGCKKIRDDQGFWQQVEKYVSDRSGARFSHSFCPDCLRIHYPDIAESLLESMEKDIKT